MKFTNNAEAALQQPGTKSVVVPMTDERKEKYGRICEAIVELLRKETEGPVEAYMVLQFVQHALEDMAGIRGGIIVEHGEEMH